MKKNMKIKKIIKNIIGISIVYTIAILFMLCLSNRVEKLDQKKELSTPNVQNMYR